MHGVHAHLRPGRGPRARQVSHGRNADLAAIDAEAAQGLLTLCVILPEAEAGEGAEAALRDARTLADLAHALRSGWGEAAASELERLCMKP